MIPGTGQNPTSHSGLGPSWDPRSATVATIIQSTPVFLAVTSLGRLETLPPTGHPEACWNTMPDRTRAPAPGSNMEVTSSKKNCIVSKVQHRRKRRREYQRGVFFSFPGFGVKPRHRARRRETAAIATFRSDVGVRLRQRSPSRGWGMFPHVVGKRWQSSSKCHP